MLTDLGTTTDVARAVAIRPDGRIVVAGTADGDVALVRYTDEGEVDDSFGDHGISESPTSAPTTSPTPSR